jgi:hypothetical protein
MRSSLALALGSLLVIACEDGASPRSPGPSDDAVTEEGLGPQQLRLLTRREYNATVHDLLAGTSPKAACETDVGCSFREESCVGGTCQADPCELVTFVLEGYESAGGVVVAGSFNDWAASAEAGGWAMTFEPSIGAWVTKRPLPDGEHTYKLVVDGTTWLTDPDNPVSVPDGFGGFNSVVAQSCAGQAPPPSGGVIADFAADLPVESRPEGYAFDNAAIAGLVTSVHVEQYLRAGETIAELATGDLQALLGCQPESAEDPCVRDFVERFGRRAFRRPLAADEADRLAGLLSAQRDLQTGVRVYLQVVLSSPSFLYRSEIGEDAGDGSFKLTAYEVATALAYTFTGSTPSDALLDAAEGGALDSPEGIDAAARDLLDDPRARETVGVFAEQWLSIESIEAADKSPSLYPELTADLAESMKAETRDLVARVALDGAPFSDLFLASTTSATGSLAALYGAGTDGSLPQARQAGLLAHASVLSAQSHSDQTSPVRRGVFVRTRLLCQELPPPPANAGGIPEVDPNATTRERFSQHSADPTCSGCHRHLDPVGFGFEGFDAIGRARDSDAGKPVDVSGVVLGVEELGAEPAQSFNGLPELGAILVASERAKTCLVRQLHRRASGAMETEEDEGTIASLSERFAASGHDVRELLVSLTQVKGFTHRRAR